LKASAGIIASNSASSSGVKRFGRLVASDSALWLPSANGTA
jgi:hypothetical protein